MLNRDAPYVQIIEHYRGEIRDGRLQDGDMLPSAREIATQFGVSIATAAKVATGLQALGLVTPRPGAGTVVTATRRSPADRAKGGPLLITLATRSPMRAGDKQRVLEAGMVPAPQHVAAELGVESFAEVVHRSQATVRDQATAALLNSWFPASAAKTVPDLLTRSRLTEQIPGYQPAWGEDWVSARPPTSAEARQFGIKRGQPVCVVHARHYDEQDTVIEYAELITRGDTRLVYRYRYTTPNGE
jgi:DNA-binding GntR family transcriptional regulator